MCIQGRGVIMN